jgi:class 3 adenylate cyclase
MVVFNDPVPVENPALQAVLMALELRDAIGALTETWRRWGHDIGFGIGIAHGFATLGTIGFEGRFDYAAIGTVSNVASRLCDEAKPGQILISPRVLTKVENAIKVCGRVRVEGDQAASGGLQSEDVTALLRDYHAAIGEIIFKYSGTRLGVRSNSKVIAAQRGRLECNQVLICRLKALPASASG